MRARPRRSSKSWFAAGFSASSSFAASPTGPKGRASKPQDKAAPSPFRARRRLRVDRRPFRRDTPSKCGEGQLMGKPRINHVALTIDKTLLDGEGRAKLIDFYSSVFGWEPIPQLTIDGRRLVFRMYEKGQFLYLI